MPNRAWSSALAWSDICCRRASTTFWKISGSSSNTANSSRPRAIASAACCASSAVRPPRACKQSAIWPVSSSQLLVQPADSEQVQVCSFSSSFRRSLDLIPAELERGACRGLHQAAEVIGLPEPLEPAHRRASELVRHQVHRQGGDRRAAPTVTSHETNAVVASAGVERAWLAMDAHRSRQRHESAGTHSAPQPACRRSRLNCDKMTGLAGRRHIWTTQ